jgi:hypothetical protein
VIVSLNVFAIDTPEEWLEFSGNRSLPFLATGRLVAW